MTRLLTLLAAVAAVLAGGVRLDPSVRMGKTALADGSTTNGAAITWAASNGFRLESTEALENTATYEIYRLARTDDCRLIVVPLGNPDEIMPLLQKHFSDDAPQERRLLLTALQEMPETALGVHYRRLRSRVTEHRGAQPVLLMGEVRCMTAERGRPLSPWPEL
jgi:hypothetical protein